jgi:hypothetical protein
MVKWRSLGTILNRTESIRKLIKKLGALGSTGALPNSKDAAYGLLLLECVAHVRRRRWRSRSLKSCGSDSINGPP